MYLVVGDGEQSTDGYRIASVLVAGSSGFSLPAGGVTGATEEPPLLLELPVDELPPLDGVLLEEL